MKTLIQAMQAVVSETDRVNYRDRRAHYASGNLTCLRDQYWQWKKEPETNPTDFLGSMKMMVGNAVEDGLVKNLISRLHFIGWHVIGTQVPVGGSNPNWDGYLDLLMAKKTETGWDKFVVEIKSKSGFGADLFWQRPEPSPEYMTQLGLYLRDLHHKGVTDHGSFLYLLLSDSHFGELVSVYSHYDSKTDSVVCTSAERSDGTTYNLDMSLCLTGALERWKVLDKHLATNTVPAGEYQYKYPLTPETLQEIPDTKLKKIVEGTLIFGDWQPMYSRFKDKQLALDNIVPERTEEERNLARAEYRKRHPRSKI
ncbi:hypothetical protein EB118_04270 [bacterium]|nr:hypothetical protein [bacterium]